MQRKHLNLLMATVAVALIVVIVLSQEKEEPAVPLTALQIDNIDHIEVIHPGKKPIVLDKYSYGWALSAPAQVSAEELQVNALLELATRETSARYPAAEMNLKELELDPPQWTIKLNDTELHFGGKEPVEDRRYVQVGEQVMLVSDPPSTALDANYSDLVHPLIIPDSENQIEAIRFADYRIGKDADGNWQVRPQSAGKGADATQTLIDHWNGARSLWRAMLTEEDKPEASAWLMLGDKEVEFQIVAREPQLKLARPDVGVVYALPPRYATDLFELQEPEPEEDTEEPEAAGGGLLPDELQELDE